MYSEENNDLDWSDDLMEFYQSLSKTGRLLYLYDITIAANENLDDETYKFFDSFYEEKVSREYYLKGFSADTDKNFRILGIGSTIFINFAEGVDYREIVRPLFMNGLILVGIHDMSWMKMAEEIKDQLIHPNIRTFRLVQERALLISVS